MVAFRRLIAAFLLFSALSGSAQAAENSFFSQPDKITHMGVSFQVSFLATRMLERNGMARMPACLTSIGMTLALGAVKEFLIDKKYTPEDQMANAVGALASSLVVLTFEF